MFNCHLGENLTTRMGSVIKKIENPSCKEVIQSNVWNQNLFHIKTRYNAGNCQLFFVIFFFVGGKIWITFLLGLLYKTAERI